MPWYGFIHPLLAIGTFAYGVALGQTSMSKLNDWNFPLRRQRYRSIVFFLLCAANFVVGLVASAMMRGTGHGVKITGHMPLAVVALIFSVIGTLVTFARAKPGELSGTMRLHPVIIIIALASILTMGFLSIMALFGA